MTTRCVRVETMGKKKNKIKFKQEDEKNSLVSLTDSASQSLTSLNPGLERYRRGLLTRFYCRPIITVVEFIKRVHYRVCAVRRARARNGVVVDLA